MLPAATSTNSTNSTSTKRRLGPQPGPQEEFLRKRWVDIVIYGGAAGGGKSYALLLDALWHAALQPTPNFGAVIFRRTSPQITATGGLWETSQRIYPYAHGKPRQTPWLGWEWPEHRTSVRFHHLQHEEDKLAWQGSQLEYCCEEDTLIVMGDGTTKPLRDVAAGDEVMTLEGPRQVTRATARRLEECVEAIVYGDSDALIGRQVHTRNHRVLTPEGWVSYDDIAGESRPFSSSSSRESRSAHRCVALFGKRYHVAARSRGSQDRCPAQADESSLSLARRQFVSGISACAARPTQETDCAVSACDSRVKPQRLSVSVPVMLHERRPQSDVPSARPLSRERDASCAPDWSLPVDFQRDCGAYSRHGDARPRHASSADRAYPQPRGGAAERSPSHCSSGVTGKVQTRSRSARQYVHPYTRDRRRSCADLGRGTCVLTPCGKHWVRDLTISAVSHYCTTSGLVNQNCGFDELTHFSEGQVFYLLSRLRNSSGGVKPVMRATTNPDPDSWVKRFLAPWVDDTYPDPAQSGEVRWFYREGDDILWLRTPLDRPAHIAREDVHSVTFIAAHLEDNPALMEADPGYRGRLQALPLVERIILSGGPGAWNIRPSGNLFKRHWFPIVDTVPAQTQFERVVRRWDLAASVPRKGHSDPDWTVGVKMGRTPGGDYYVLDAVFLRSTPAEVKQAILQTAQLDGQHVQVRLPQDPGQAGKAQLHDFVRLLDGYDVRGELESGDKETRARPLSAQAEVGNVKLVHGHWNEQYLNQLTAFPNPLVHDDAVDASAGAYNELARSGGRIAFALARPEMMDPAARSVLVAARAARDAERARREAEAAEAAALGESGEASLLPTADRIRPDPLDDVALSPEERAAYAAEQDDAVLATESRAAQRARDEQAVRVGRTLGVLRNLGLGGYDGFDG